VRPPASLSPRALPGPVALGDLRGALLAWLGLDAPRGALERVLAPREPVFGQWRDRIFTVFDGRWRLVWNPDGVEPDDPPPGPYPVPRVALFDVAADPVELVDVSAAHPEVVERLREELQRWRAPQRPPERASPPPDAERLRAMRELGYAGDEPEGDRSPPERD
jgi:hypothetical protein